jgi:hypothetical protein
MVIQFKGLRLMVMCDFVAGFAASAECQKHFSGEKDNNFLELERRDALSTVPTYNYRIVPERSCANNEVVYVVTFAIEDNYIPIEQLTFQSAAAHRPASLGKAALKSVS